MMQAGGDIVLEGRFAGHLPKSKILRLLKKHEGIGVEVPWVPDARHVRCTHSFC